MKLKTIYRCSNCNQEHISWAGKCPSCGAWNSLVEEVVDIKQKKDISLTSSSGKRANRLKNVKIDQSERILTGLKEFDKTVGGGLVRDSVSILTAKPGAGKSTLLLELSEKLAFEKFKVLYISGEESESQIKQRAIRIMKDIPDEIFLLATSSMDLVLEEIKRVDPDVVFLDSIQTLALGEFPQRPGSPTQTIECASRLVDICKAPERPRAAIMVGHMTKNDQMAGLMTLEHLVDTVLYLEADLESQLRILRTTKNRFGYTGEIGLFNMEEDGLIEVKNPSQHFITSRDYPVEGSAISVIKEGTRLITVELESLVSNSFTPYPIRIGDSLRKDQLNTLISIIEERAGIKMYDKNVILKTRGGLKLNEQAANLAIIMSIVSSLKKKGLSSKDAFIAEVGLTGELKSVPNIEDRLVEIDRLGFSTAYVPKGKYDKRKIKNLKLVELKDINEVIEKLWTK